MHDEWDNNKHYNFHFTCKKAEQDNCITLNHYQDSTRSIQIKWLILFMERKRQNFKKEKFGIEKHTFWTKISVWNDFMALRLYMQEFRFRLSIIWSDSEYIFRYFLFIISLNSPAQQRCSVLLFGLNPRIMFHYARTYLLNFFMCSARQWGPNSEQFVKEKIIIKTNRKNKRK